MAHTINLWMQDHPGVLHRAVSLLRRRGYNIESLAVGRSETPGVSRMTLVVEADDVAQVTAQLDRLIEVLAVRDVTQEPAVERETALLTVLAPATQVAPVLGAAGCGARVVDGDAATTVLEVTDHPATVESLIERLRAFGIREMVRTGRVALTRGPAAAAPAHVSFRPDPLPTTWLTQADGARDAGPQPETP